MAITYTPSMYTGDRFTEIYKDVLFANNTLRNQRVRLMDDIKFQRTLTSLNGSIVIQPFTSARPAPAGSMNFGDSLIKPVKATIYDQFDPEVIYRRTVFAETLPKGVQNIVSEEGNQMILAYVVELASRAQEIAFWGGISADTKAAVAAGPNAGLTTAAEKTYVAALTANTYGFDGLISKLIIQTLTPAGTPEQVDTILVTGTTLSAGNILVELNKVYSAIPQEIKYARDTNSPLNDLAIFADYSVRDLVLGFNEAQQFRGDLITVAGDTFAFRGVPIYFVPMPTPNTMIAANRDELIWGTDVSGDVAGYIEIGPLEAFSYIQAYRMDFAIASAVVKAQRKVLYLA